MHADSDRASCRSSRKSTSGGVVSTNIGVVEHWSATQSLVALSSCEAKLYAMNKGAAEATRIRSLAADAGFTLDIVLKSEASTALGVVNRRGVGKTRHVDAQELWLQNAVRNRELEGRWRGERRGHTHDERDIRGAHGRNGIHQDNKTRYGCT